MVLVAAAVAAGVLAGPAQAQQAGPEPTVRLIVSEVDGVLGPAMAEPDAEPAEDLRLRLLVENDGSDTLEDLEVVIEAHPRATARSVLHAALDADEPPRPSRPVARVAVRDGLPLPPGDIASLDVRVTGTRGGWLGSNGVFPVEISVVRGTTVLDHAITAVVHLTSLGTPVTTTLVWPVEATPQRGADGSYPVGTDALLGPGGPVDAEIAAAERGGSRALTLAPSASLLYELLDRSDGYPREDGSFAEASEPGPLASAALLQRLRRLAAGLDVDPVVSPYGGVDVAALAAGPDTVSELAAAALATARTRTQEILGRAPDLTAMLARTALTPGALDVMPVDHLLVDYGQIQGPSLDPDPDLPGAARSVRSASGRALPTTVADPHVTRLLGTTGSSPALARQRLTAELALLHLEDPDSPRALLVVPPAGWEPDPLTAGAMMDGLLDAPWLHLVSADSLAAWPEPEDATLTRAAASLPSDYTTELVSARRLLDALQAAMPSHEQEPSTQSLAALGDALLRSAQPEALAEGGAIAIDRIRQVIDQIEDGFGTVDVPDGLRVTLASAEGDVPVTVQRRSGADIRILVEVDSVGRLTWADDARVQELLLPADASVTVAFPTRAVSRGTFPVTVKVWDPTRTRLLDSATLSVRATAISRPAFIGVAVVVVALLLAGARRRRRPARPPLKVVE